MIYKVSENILEEIVKQFPYIRYNDTQFYSLEEDFYTPKGQLKEPWPEDTSTVIHRMTASLPISEPKFEEDPKSLLQTSKEFFDIDVPKTLVGARHILLLGKKNKLEFTELSNWKVVSDLLNLQGLDVSLTCSRFLIRIPCGLLNLNITKLFNTNETYLEVTMVEPDADYQLKDLVQRLNLTEPMSVTWADICYKQINRSNAEES